VKIGEDKLVYVREAKNPKAVTIVIRGGSEHVVDEAEGPYTTLYASSGTPWRTVR